MDGPGQTQSTQDRNPALLEIVSLVSSLSSDSRLSGEPFRHCLFLSARLIGECQDRLRRRAYIVHASL